MAGPPRVAVVTDSTVSLPREYYSSLPLWVVPLEVVIEGKTYQDGVDISAEEFYALFPRLTRPPTTSSPQPASWLEAFRQAAGQASSVLCITLASALSTTFRSALAAQEMAREALPGLPIRVTDSTTAGGGLAWVALAAARRAREGAGLEEVEAYAREVAGRVHFLGVLNTLYYTWKGGRIPRLALWATSLLNIKPILELSQGQIKMVERPRSRPRALDRLLALVRQRTTGRPLRVNVMHASAPDEAEGLAARLRDSFPIAELLVSTFTPVIGAHTGPGLLGLAFYEEANPRPLSGRGSLLLL